jgi:hypothetical protein
MAAVEAAIRVGRDRRSVVVVPYGTIDEWHESPAEAQAYEERLLCSLLELRDPNADRPHDRRLLPLPAHAPDAPPRPLAPDADRSRGPHDPPRSARSCSSVRACST